MLAGSTVAYIRKRRRLVNSYELLVVLLALTSNGDVMGSQNRPYSSVSGDYSTVPDAARSQDKSWDEDDGEYDDGGAMGDGVPQERSRAQQTERRDDSDRWGGQSQRDPRELPMDLNTGEPPPPFSSRLPIDYPFPRTQEYGNDPDAPLEDEPASFASPRKDALARYTSSTKNKIKVKLSSSILGTALGAAIGKSIINNPKPFAWAGCLLFFLMTFTRGDYGEMSRAIGLALIFSIQRTKAVRRTYPTKPHLKSIIGMAERTIFPPPTVTRGTRRGEPDDIDDNPWSYVPQYMDDVDFRMMPTVLAMAFVGTICGGNLPVIPTWMGAVSFAAAFAYFATTRDAKGDLARSMGMRVVALVEEVIAINSELYILSKVKVVGGKVLDKLLILDRKHSIRDKIGTSMRWVYGKVSRAAGQVQSDMQQDKGGEDEDDVMENDRKGGPGMRYR